MSSANSENSASFTNTQNNNEEDEDPVEEMIKKTGCVDFHFKVQVTNILCSENGCFYFVVFK